MFSLQKYVAKPLDKMTGAGEKKEYEIPFETIV